jgi:phage tail sheath protein FI
MVIDQEYFEKLSWEEESSAFVVDALSTSEMARVGHPYPTHRPEITAAVGSYEATYVDHTQAGTDGAGLSDYDLIGSRREHSGLFALEQVEYFDLLYLPPPGKGRDLGPAAVLAAELYCRERSAMLIVDPLLDWTTADSAVDGVSDLGYASANLLGYYPRVRDRGSDDEISRPAGGALAGLLCKQDRTYGPWQSLDQQGMGLHRKLRPERELSEGDKSLLVRAGLNVLVPGPVGKARVAGSVTMGRGSEGNATFAKLPVRRLCLQIINSISRATRWAVFESADATLADRLRGQVLTYLSCLDDLGAFANDNFIVQCDAGVSKRSDLSEHGITILLVVHPVDCDEPVSMTLHQTATGIRVGSTAFGLTFRHTGT